MTLNTIASGADGCLDGGTEVISAGGTVYVCNGIDGSDGAQGLTGPVGPVGPAGPMGPAGKVEVVTCKAARKGKKEKCRTKLVSGTVELTAKGVFEEATLSRHGKVYAAGIARVEHGRTRLRLARLRRLRPGRYTLTLISGSGRHETIHDTSFMLS